MPLRDGPGIRPSHHVFSDDDDQPSSGFPSCLETHSALGNDPARLSLAYHVHQAEVALSRLKRSLSESEGWKKVLRHKSGVVVYVKRLPEDKTPIFKGDAVIHGFSPHSVFYVVGMRKLWDEQYDDGHLVENLNETTSLTYELLKPTSGLCTRPRDMALVEKIECTQDGTILFACTSVETARVPRIQGRIRAHIKLLGWALQPVPGPTPATRVTYIVQEDLKGWMPGLAKKTLARRPLAIAMVDGYLQQKAGRCRWSDKRKQPLQPPRVPPPTLQSPAPLESSGTSTLRTVDSTVKTPSTSPRPRTTTTHTRHTYPPHRHQALKATTLTQLKTLQSLPDNHWTWEEHPDIRVGALAQNPSIRRMQGTILGGWTPEQLCAMIHCFGSRQQWDSTFISGNIIERFSQKDYLVAWRLVTDVTEHEHERGCEHEVAVFTTIQTEPTGRVWTTAVGVDDPEIPLPPADNLVYGWMFERAAQGVHVIYVSNLGSSETFLQWKQVVSSQGCPPYLRRVAGKVLHEAYEPQTLRYTLVYIARHSPASTRRRWCTEISIQGYNGDVQIVLSPSVGTRVERAGTLVRVYTTEPRLENQQISVLIQPQQVCEAATTATATAAATASATTTMSLKIPDSPMSLPSPPVTPRRPRPRRTPSLKDEAAPRLQNVIVLSDELTFHAHQLAVVFLLMVFSYYMGKLASPSACGSS